MREDLLAGKLTQSEIAARHGVSRASVARASDALAEHTADAVEKGYEEIRALIPEAIATLKKHLLGEGKVAVQAANSLLDRSGLVKTEKREHSGPGGGSIEVRIVHLTAAQEEAIANEGNK